MNPEDAWKVGVYANERIQREKQLEALEKQNKLLEKQIEATENAERAAKVAVKKAAKRTVGSSGNKRTGAKFCHQCGQAAQVNDKFCSECGSALRTEVSANPTSSRSETTTADKRRKATANETLDPILEKALRMKLKKPTGELTKADYEKVTELDLFNKQLTEVPKGLENLTQLEQLFLGDNQLTSAVKELEKLTQLELLFLQGNPDLTKAQIVALQKALPKCKIVSNPTK